MGSHRCADCDINYPFSHTGKPCLVCNGKTSYVPSLAPHSRWREIVEERLAELEVLPSEEDHVLNDIEQWRFKILNDNGFNAEQAYVLARDRSVHIRDVISWLDKGCPVDTAFQIAS